MIEIPLNNYPEQFLSTVISGQTYDLRVVFNSRSKVWSISVSQNGSAIVDGVALLGGVDIFDQYNIGIKNAYVVNLDDDKQDPTPENLGSSAKLFILEDEDLSNE
jgi:hypothetical protein